MEELVEQVEELKAYLQSIDTDAQTLHNAQLCTSLLGNELIDTKISLEMFPFDQLVGQHGIAGLVKNLAGSKEAVSVLQDMFRIFRHILEKYSTRIHEKDMLYLQSFCDSVYYITTAAKIKLEALKLIEVLLPLFKKQDDSYEVERIADKYFKELTRSNKLSSTVCSQLKIVLGKLIQVFPDRLRDTPLPDRLKRNYIDYLKNSLSSKTASVDLTLIQGTLAGLEYIIDGVGISPDEDVELFESLYECLKRMCRLPDKESEVSRRGAMRQALSLFSRHSTLFSKIILKDVPDWYVEVTKWRASKNTDDHRAGFRAVTALFQAVSIGLSSAHESDVMPRPLVFLVNQFNSIIKNSSSSEKETSLAIQGYGQFAAQLARYLTEEEYRNLVIEIISSTERFHVESEEVVQEKWRTSFPNHIQAVSSLVSVLPSPGQSILHSVESVCLHLVRQFPLIPHQFHQPCISALVSVLCSSTKNEGNLLENLIYHALVESCSHPAVSEDQILPPEVISYKKYLPLWKGLLNQQGQDHRIRTFNAYMKSLLEVIEKLDLSVIETEGLTETATESANIDISLTLTDEGGVGGLKQNLDKFVYEGKRARVCKDYTVLVNAVDLSLSLLEGVSPDLVAPWLLDTWARVAAWSYLNPEASSFYKLVSRLLVIMDFESDSKEMVGATQLVQEYLRNHITRMSYFDQTELRISAYFVIANLPIQLIPKLLDVLPQAIEQVLDLSSTIPSLANPMLKTLLKMSDKFSESELDSVYRAGLPKLRVFLSWTPSDSSSRETKKLKSGPIRNKAKSSGEKLQVRNYEEENCNMSLQILAKVTSEYKKLFLPTPEELGETLTAWDTNDHLKLEVPLPDVLVILKLDSLLPLVVDVVTTSTDRRARVAAGESLHALLLFMIGRTSQQTDDLASKAPMTSLFKRIFPVVLQLCSDTDSVLQGLFQPLFSQMIHWFTKDSKRGSPETECLLECLVDTLCSSKDMGMKQEAGMFLQEFIVWSLKQSRTTSTNNVNIKSLLNRLYFLLRHPDVNKRLGGCAVFTQIYRILREDRNLVSDYLLEILSSFIICIKISHNDPPFCATLGECEKSVGHVKRILNHYLATFQQESKTRRTPTDFSCGTLSGLLDWLLQYLMVEQPAARKAALLLFTQICQATGASQRKVLEDKFGSIQIMMKQVLSAASQTVNTTDHKLDTATLNAYCSVFELTLWLLGCNICKWDEVCQVIDWLIGFIKRISCESEKRENEGSSFAEFRSDREKKETVIRFWTLVTCIVDSGHGDQIIEKTHHLHDVIVPVMMEPSKNGFNFKQEKEKEEFHREILALLKSIQKRMPGYYSKLELYFNKVYLESRLFSLEHILNGCLKGGVDKSALSAYHFLMTNSIFTKHVDVEVLLTRLLDGLPETGTELSTLPLETVQNLTQLVDLISKCANSPVLQQVCDMAMSQKPKCVWFTKVFSKFFFPTLLENIDKVVQGLAEEGNTVKVYDTLLLYAKNFKKSMQHDQARFLDCLSKHWELLTANDSSRSNTLKIIHLVRIVFESVETNNHSISKTVLKWFCDKLKNSKLNLKIKYKTLSLLCLMLETNTEAGPEILDSLKVLGTLHFPVFSKELKEGSCEHELYILVFKQILTSLEVSQSKDILYFVISVICRDEGHICEEMINQSIASMINKSDVDSQINLVRVPHEIFCNKTGLYSYSVKLAALSKFVIPSLQASSPMAVRRFFGENLEELLTQVNTKVEGSDERMLGSLTRLVGVLKLLAVLYSKLDASMVHMPGGIISQKAATILREKNLFAGKGDGKEMTGYLMKFLLESRTWKIDGSPQVKTLLREFHKERLNCSIAIISCTNVNEKVYNHYIFKEAKDKDQLIWSRIVDTEKEMKLELLLDKQFTTRKDYVVIKQSYSETFGQSLGSQTHYLADSSLSQDISKYDYTGTMSQSVNMAERLASNSSDRASFLEIEEDEFGDNSCLTQLIALVHFMSAAKIYTPPADNFESCALPIWIQSVVAPLLDRSACRNVKLFILNFIFKCSDAFCPYAIQLYKPVMTCLTDGTVSPDGKLNYLALDLVTMLLFWSDKTGTKPSSEETLSTKILSLMMKNVYHEERRIFKINIEIVGTIIDKWRGCFQIGSCFTILEQLLDPRGDDIMKLGGLKLLSLFLVQDLKDLQVLSNVDFAKGVVACFSSRRKDIYEQSGVCIGLLLKALKPLPEHYENCFLYVSKELGEMSLQTTADKKSRFYIILHGIQKNYPNILPDFTSRFKYSLKTLNGDDLNICLEMIVAYSTYLTKEPDKLKVELNMMGVKSFLRSYDPSVQILALKIVKQIHLFLMNDIKLDYYNLIKDFMESKYIQQRREVFEIFKEAYVKNEGEILDLTLESLMKLLKDKNAELREEATDFFKTTVITSNDSFERLVQIMNMLKMDANGMLVFLPTGILAPGDSLPTSKQKLFHAPLDQCAFKDYSFDTSWRTQYTSTLMPLYADSLVAQSQATSRMTQATQMIQATVSNLEFSQTQSANASIASGVNEKRPDDSRSLFMSRDLAKAQFRVGNLVAGKRFMKEQPSAAHQTSMFSKLAERKRVQNVHMEEDRRKSQTKNVRLMRKYRVGDLPDIQILISDLLKPIISLSQYSSQVSIRLAVETMQSIVNSNEELMTDDSHSALMSNLNTLLRDCCEGNVDVAKAILEICLKLNKGDMLDTKEVAKVCVRDGLERYGIVLFEKHISASSVKEYIRKSDNKRMKMNEDCDVEMIIHFIDLLKNANEFDNVKGILGSCCDKLNIHPKTQEALREESEMEWANAVKIYRTLLEDDQLRVGHLDVEVNMWNKGYLDSLAKLGKWETIDSEIESKFDTSSGFVIGNLMSSGMHLSVEKQNSQVYNFLSKSFEDGEKRKSLKKYYPYEISVILGMKNKYQDSQLISKDAVGNYREKIFIKDLAGSCDNDLYKLQSLVELNRYLDQPCNSQNLFEEISKVWNSNNPVNGGDLNEWDKILSGRLMFIHKLENNGDIQDGEDLLSTMTNIVAQNYANLSLLALKDSNLIYAKRGLKRMKIANCQGTEKLAALRRSIISKVALMNSGKRDNLTSMDDFCNVLRTLSESKHNSSDSSHVKDIKACLFKIAHQDSTLTTFAIRKQLELRSSKDLDTFDAVFGKTSDSNEDLCQKLKSNVLEYFSQIHMASCHDLADEMMEGAKFTDHLLKIYIGSEDLARLCVSYHLKAMELGSLSSRQMFPRCLNLIKNFTSCRQEFVSCVKSVPTWTFLPWQNQLISCLCAEDTFSTYSDLVTRMVKEYPHAMINSILLQMSRSHELSDDALNVIFSFRDMCADYASYNVLVHHMSYLCLPDVLLKDFSSTVEQLKKEFPNDAKFKVQQELKEFLQKYFKNSDMKGNLYNNFFKEHGAAIEQSIRSLSKIKEDLKKIAKTVGESTKSSYSLKDFSPYLFEFLASNSGFTIEVPGQYGHFMRPDPARHVFVSSFGPSVPVFRSLRKPVQLTILGSNGQRFPFIVKAGEDVRLDQRIESLFEMSNICVQQTFSGGKNLNINTYNVVPLSEKLGLIQFVANTSPIKDFLSVGKSTADLDIAQDRLQKGILKLAKGNSPFDAYRESVKVRLDQIVMNYEQAVQCAESDHLRCSMMKLSAGTQEFFMLRRNFVTSYSSVSIMQWILGIGDRHLSNYLICKKSGRIIPIDFGYSFGIATSYLPIPELVQLRLSPQILGVLGHNLHGLFRETMVQVLNCLRTNSDLLMATLDMIVQEPAIDWLNFATMVKGHEKETVMCSFARDRVKLTQDKLKGAHPALVMEQELRSGTKRDHLANLIKFVKGDRVHSRQVEQLSSTEQVDLLIQQSTDSNLLGRMWIGWSPHA